MIGIDQEWINSLLVCPRWSQSELLNEVDNSIKTYEQRRKIAEEILKKTGMEEAIIDELEMMGFSVIEKS